jgi:hypothetical protein
MEGLSTVADHSDLTIFRSFGSILKVSTYISTIASGPSARTHKGQTKADVPGQVRQAPMINARSSGFVLTEPFSKPS